MKKRYIFQFSPESIDLPITYILIKDFDIKVNILNADISSGQSGKLVLDMEADTHAIDQALSFVTKKNIECLEVTQQLSFRKDLCVACGACTAVCFNKALAIQKPDWKLEFDPEKCVVCGLCVHACPLQLFNLEKSGHV